MNKDDELIRILHVDDDQSFLDLVAEFLENQSSVFTVETALGAPTGLEKLSETEFDCIVSDFDMPRQNGIEFLEAVRDEYPDLPFILYTGKGSEEIASEAISAGVTDYLQKETGTSQYEVLANRIRNVVEQSRARRVIRETEEWASKLLEHSSDYVFVVDEQGRTTYVSPAIRRVLGYEPGDVIDSLAFETIHPEDVELAADAFAQTLETPDEVVTVEFRAEHADGSYRWLEVRGRNLLDDPVVDGILVNARDITAQKEHREALRETEERFRRIAESASDAIITIDTDSTIKYANPAVERIFGYSPMEVENEPITMLMPQRLREQHRTAIDQYLETGEQTLDWTGTELPGLHKDGHEITLEISFSELQWNDRHRFTGIIREKRS